MIFRYSSKVAMQLLISLGLLSSNTVMAQTVPQLYGRIFSACQADDKAFVRCLAKKTSDWNLFHSMDQWSLTHGPDGTQWSTAERKQRFFSAAQNSSFHTGVAAGMIACCSAAPCGEVKYYVRDWFDRELPISRQKVAPLLPYITQAAREAYGKKDESVDEYRQKLGRAAISDELTPLCSYSWNTSSTMQSRAQTAIDDVLDTLSKTHNATYRWTAACKIVLDDIKTTVDNANNALENFQQAYADCDGNSCPSFMQRFSKADLAAPIFQVVGVHEMSNAITCDDLVDVSYDQILQSAQKASYAQAYTNVFSDLQDASQQYINRRNTARQNVQAYNDLCAQDANICTKVAQVIGSDTTGAEMLAVAEDLSSREADYEAELESQLDQILQNSADTVGTIEENLRNFVSAVNAPLPTFAIAQRLSKLVTNVQAHEQLLSDIETREQNVATLDAEQRKATAVSTCRRVLDEQADSCNTFESNLGDKITPITNKLSEVDTAERDLLLAENTAAADQVAVRINTLLSDLTSGVNDFQLTLGAGLPEAYRTAGQAVFTSAQQAFRGNASIFTTMSEQAVELCRYEAGGDAAVGNCRNTFQHKFTTAEDTIGDSHTNIANATITSSSQCRSASSICGALRQMAGQIDNIPNSCSVTDNSCLVQMNQILINLSSLRETLDRYQQSINSIVSEFEAKETEARAAALAQSRELAHARRADADAVIQAANNDYAQSANTMITQIQSQNSTALCTLESNPAQCQQHFDAIQAQAQTAKHSLDQTYQEMRDLMPSVDGCGHEYASAPRATCQEAEDNKIVQIRAKKDEIRTQHEALTLYLGALEGRSDAYQALAERADHRASTASAFGRARADVSNISESRQALGLQLTARTAEATAVRATHTTEAGSAVAAIVTEAVTDPTSGDILTVDGSQPVVGGDYNGWANSQLQLAQATVARITARRDAACQLVPQAEKDRCSSEFQVYLDAANNEIQVITQAKQRIEQSTLQDEEGPAQQAVIQISQATLALYERRYTDALARLYQQQYAGDAAVDAAARAAGDQNAADLAIAAADAASEAATGPRRMPPIRRFDIHNCTASSDYAPKTWCGYIQRGAHFSTGNTDSMNFGMDAAIARRQGKWEFGAVGDFDYVKTEGEVVDEDYWVGLKVKYNYSAENSWFDEAAYQSIADRGYTYIISDILGIEHRMQYNDVINMVLGAGIGARHSLTTEAQTQTDYTQDLRAQIAWMITQWANLDQYFSADIGNFGQRLTVWGSTTSLTTWLSDSLSMVYSFEISHRSEVPSGRRTLEHNGKVGLRYDF